ncbi:MAG TPA: zinc-binding dehydrogenase [Acidimicrobiales bacterium]|nr:zinc-binding dehydrogenase [Acidimicrobiales bacterium]
MKALVVERSVPRFAAARMASGWRAGAGVRVGPLHLSDVEVPEPPGPGWHRVRPRLSGICGSDLATVDGRSSRWFEPVVSFPFTPGHEVVGDLDDGGRVVIEPVLACAARAIVPPCEACAAGEGRRCRHLTGGHLAPGLQTGYCADTGGGWSLAMVAHDSQLRAVPDAMSDASAVMVEPAACAVHGVLSAPAGDDFTAVVIGAGTLGLCAIAALARYRPDVTTTIAVAKHPEQQSLARQLGADVVAAPGELRRAVRRQTGSWILDSGQLTGGSDLVIDCVGSAASLADALAVTAPGGTIVMVGIPGQVSVDLTPMWQREIRLTGAYTYGSEPGAGGRHSFDLAFDLVEHARLDRLVSATYPLDRFTDAIEHAASAGRRGGVKVAFDLRGEKRR